MIALERKVKVARTIEYKQIMAPTSPRVLHPSASTQLDSPQQPLQAVLLADADALLRFLPFSHEMPRCLMPLANVPLIEYAIESLAVSEVKECFIFCGVDHYEMLRTYVQSRLQPQHKCSWRQLRVQVLAVREGGGVGDMLRDLDRRALIQSDFLLIHGDLVSNIQLQPILDLYRWRRDRNKEIIMTMIMQKGHGRHRSRSKADEAVLVLDPYTQELLHYEPLFTGSRSSKFSMELERLQKHPVFQMRHDLMDCHVDICSMDVPALFSENFDYQDIRKDFVRGILQSDILTKSIHVHVLQDDQYAARVSSWHMYDSISRDMLNRWLFPLTPERNLLASDRYMFLRGQIYKEPDVVLARTCKVERQVLLGGGTEVGEGSVVRQSTIGKHCKIGKQVVIEGCYIWDHVVIGDGCILRQCVIGSHTVLQPNVVLQVGCLIANNVVLGPNVTLKAGTRVSSFKPPLQLFSDMESESESESPDRSPHDSQDLGASSKGWIWSKSVEEIEEETELYGSLRPLDIGFQEEDPWWVSSDEEEIEQPHEETTREEEFHEEAQKTMCRALDEGHDVDVTILEINSLKMSYNVTDFQDIRKACIPVLLQHCNFKQPESFMKVWKKWAELVTKYGQSFSDQKGVLSIVVEYCEKLNSPGPFFGRILMTLYEIDIVEETTIQRVFDEDIFWERPSCRALRKVMGDFINYLESLETESEDNDEDEEDEEESEQSELDSDDD